MTVPSDLPPPSNVPAQPPLGAQTFRGSWISVGGQGAQLMVRLASTVVLARLLTPDAYGLTAMVTVVTGFVGLFKSLGLATATIQAPRLSERELSGLYWINALIGVVAMLMTLVLAPAMSWFYAEPRVAPADGRPVGHVSVRRVCRAAGRLAAAAAPVRLDCGDRGRSGCRRSRHGGAARRAPAPARGLLSRVSSAPN